MRDASSQVFSVVDSNNYEKRIDTYLRTEMMGSWHDMSPEEVDLIERLHKLLGDRWELISGRLPDRTAEEVESYWKAREKRMFTQTKLLKPVCTRAYPRSVSAITGSKKAEDSAGSGPSEIQSIKHNGNSYKEKRLDTPLRIEMMGSWHDMSPEEEDLMERLHKLVGDRWELISGRLPDRTADEVEKYWTAREKKMYTQTKLFKPICTRAKGGAGSGPSNIQAAKNSM